MFQAPHWNAGAISNAKWSGPRMRDLLADAGLDVDAIASGKKNINDLGIEVCLLLVVCCLCFWYSVPKRWSLL